LVAPEELPFRKGRTVGGKYLPLYHEALLRLEQTALPDYIAYDFPVFNQCKYAIDCIRRWSARDKVDIELKFRSNKNGSASLFVRRGPNSQR